VLTPALGHEGVCGRELVRGTAQREDGAARRGLRCWACESSLMGAEQLRAAMLALWVCASACCCSIWFRPGEVQRHRLRTGLDAELDLDRGRLQRHQISIDRVIISPCSNRSGTASQG
jgi:hypothetical protein